MVFAALAEHCLYKLIGVKVGPVKAMHWRVHDQKPEVWERCLAVGRKDSRLRQLVKYRDNHLTELRKEGEKLNEKFCHIFENALESH